MNAVAIGPNMIAANRLAIIVAIVVFVIAGLVVSRRYDPKLLKWTVWGLIAGLIGARYGHVIMNLGDFFPQVWRTLAIWRGGFAPLWGLATLLVLSALMLRTQRQLQGAAIAILLAWVGWFGTTQFTRPVLNKSASDLVLEQLSGAPMSIAQAAGKPVVINIWATWCPPCRNEMPMMAEVAAANPEVTFLFVNQAEDPATVNAYLKANNLNLQHVLLDRDKQIARHYRAIGIPVTLFLDAQGKLLRLYFGEIPRELLVASVKHQIDPSRPPMLPPAPDASQPAAPK